MSIAPLNIGSEPNDGTGQNLRSGGQVINDNFAELDLRTAAAQSKADAAQPKEAGKGLSTNDYSNAEKNKVAAAIPASQKGVASGVATLGADGKLPVSQLPPLAVNEVFTVASQAAMLALSAERGDMAIRTDQGGQAYVLAADAPATLANWIAIKQSLAVSLIALGAVTPAADTLAYFNGTSTAASTAFTAKARALVGLTTNLQWQAELGLGTAAIATVTTSSTDTTPNRLLKVSDFGIGGSLAAFPASTLNDFTVATGNYVANSAVTNAPYTGAFWGLSIARFSGDSCRQIAWDLNSPSSLFFRNIDRGTIVPWQPLYNGLNAQLDPQTSGGLMSTTTVSGFVINKYLNGDMHMMGPAPTTAQLAANSVLSILVTIPSGFLSPGFIFPDATLAPSTANDHYGYISKTAEGTTQVRFLIRTGATAQNYNLNLSIWGRWK